MLANEERVKTALSVSPLLTAQLGVIGKESKSKDVKKRIEAATTLVALREEGLSLDAFIPLLPASEDRNQLMKQQALQHERFEKLIRLARLDPELLVRRQARKAEALNERAD